MGCPFKLCWWFALFLCLMPFFHIYFILFVFDIKYTLYVWNYLKIYVYYSLNMQCSWQYFGFIILPQADWVSKFNWWSYLLSHHFIDLVSTKNLLDLNPPHIDCLYSSLLTMYKHTSTYIPFKYKFLDLIDVHCQKQNIFIKYN